MPFVTYRLSALPKISDDIFCASESGVCTSGLERSPRDSTDTERSDLKIIEPNASWRPRRNGEAEKALPPLCPGVCQLVPALTCTYWRIALQKRGSQNDLKRWTIRSWWTAGFASTSAPFFDHRLCGTTTGAFPG